MLIKEMNALLLQSMCPMVLSENIWMVSICNYKRGKVPINNNLYSNSSAIPCSSAWQNPGFQPAA
jgi:hypothetical protein